MNHWKLSNENRMIIIRNDRIVYITESDKSYFNDRNYDANSNKTIRLYHWYSPKKFDNYFRITVYSVAFHKSTGFHRKLASQLNGNANITRNSKINKRSISLIDSGGLYTSQRFHRLSQRNYPSIINTSLDGVSLKEYTRTILIGEYSIRKAKTWVIC